METDVIIKGNHVLIWELGNNKILLAYLWDFLTHFLAVQSFRLAFAKEIQCFIDFFFIEKSNGKTTMLLFSS